MQLFSGEYLMHHGLQDDYLMHYGVPGMKWGVRKARGLGYRYSAAVNSAYARLTPNKTHAGMYRSAANYARKKANEIDPRKPKKSKSQMSDAERKARRKKILKRAAIAAGVGAAAVGTTIAIRKGYGRYANRLTSSTNSVRLNNSAKRLTTSALATRKRDDARRAAKAAARKVRVGVHNGSYYARQSVKNAASRAGSRVRNAGSAVRREASVRRSQARLRGEDAAYRARSAARDAVRRVRRTPSDSRAVALMTPSTRVRGSRRRAAASAARSAYSTARRGARRVYTGVTSAPYNLKKEANFHKNYRRVRGGYKRR